MQQDRSNAPAEEPPPYHDWTVVPDTALLPPPPSILYRSSPATNSSRSSADRAHAWTDVNPLWPPRSLSTFELQALAAGSIGLIRPRELVGKVEPIRQHPGTWHIRTTSKCEDACLLSNIPLYSSLHGASATAYFEVSIRSIGRDSGIAIGFIAPPYPTWRMPGWERGSLGVHSDDGRRFVNDTWGGRDFVAPFRDGDTVGVGLRRRRTSGSLQEADPPPYRQSANAPEHVSSHEVEIFFTRNGKQEGSWDLHEEVDAAMDQPGGVKGLEGERDVHAAIGVFGKCDMEVKFGRSSWALRP